MHLPEIHAATLPCTVCKQGHRCLLELKTYLRGHVFADMDLVVVYTHHKVVKILVLPVWHQNEQSPAEYKMQWDNFKQKKRYIT